MSFTLNAPAKINWFLSVINRRGDGYHNISSLMQCVDLFDTLYFEENSDISVICDSAVIPPKDNLVLKAAELLRTETGIKKGAKLSLRKGIPVAAGLGGGSSDAAYTLIGLNRLWDAGLDNQQLMELGCKLGSDVPFFINNVYAYIEGRGEIVSPLPSPPRMNLLLVNPGIPISAGWAYKSLEIGLTKKTVDIKLFCQSIDRKDFENLRSMLSNDLEVPVMRSYPEIGRIKESLYKYGAVAAAMSGSGSTVFGVFRNDEDAEAAALNIGLYWHKTVRTLINLNF